jgi:hypothetical protein
MRVEFRRIKGAGRELVSVVMEMKQADSGKPPAIVYDAHNRLFADNT